MGRGCGLVSPCSISVRAEEQEPALSGMRFQRVPSTTISYSIIAWLPSPPAATPTVPSTNSPGPLETPLSMALAHRFIDVGGVKNGLRPFAA